MITIDNFLESIYENSKSMVEDKTFKLDVDYTKVSEIDSGSLYCINYRFDHHSDDIVDFNEHVFINSGDSIEKIFINKFMDLSSRLNRDYMIESKILFEDSIRSLEIRSLGN